MTDTLLAEALDFEPPPLEELDLDLAHAHLNPTPSEPENTQTLIDQILDEAQLDEDDEVDHNGSLSLGGSDLTSFPLSHHNALLDSLSVISRSSDDNVSRTSAKRANQARKKDKPTSIIR